MVNLEMIFQQMVEGVNNGHSRYEVIDSWHVVDNQMGIEYHLYDNEPFKITKGSECLLTGNQITSSEAAILQHLKGYLTEHQRKMLYELAYRIPAQAKGTEVPLSQHL